MSIPITATTDEAHAKSWREWQLKNEHHERRRSQRARLMFMALVLAMAVWFGFQFLYR